MTDYKKLSEALQTLQNECKKHDRCDNCPLSMAGPEKWPNYICAIRNETPAGWEIKPINLIRLLESE